MTQSRRNQDWSAPVTADEAYRRAAGRRRHNATRQQQAAARRGKVCELLAKYGFYSRGAQTAIARELGVSRSTISRDVARIMEYVLPCPCCGGSGVRVRNDD